ncbi:MAG: SMP-30/gluconolactonase/LRE family protein [Agrobacterium vaccinii]
MTEIHKFTGKVLDKAQMTLGEGPSFDPTNNTLCWLNILGKELHELDLKTETKTVHALPFMASVVARIDDKRQLLATDDGLFIRDRETGGLFLHVDFEPTKPGNRSNDGRVHPSGALWIGTMGRKAEEGAGTIYHVAKGVVTTLFENISISNAICFSPDGATGYYVDTTVNRMMRVPLDPATGLPTGKPKVFIDQAGEKGGIDGSVCDAEGHIWNARWGVGAVDHYSPQGQHLARYEVPAVQSTCPVFFGASANRLGVTSACEGLDDDVIKANPLYGATFDLGIEVKGVLDAAYKA